jgi:hypothetical protein
MAYIHEEIVRKEIIGSNFVLLTVHLDAILGNDQLDALFLNVFIYASTGFHLTGTSVTHQSVLYQMMY